MPRVRYADKAREDLVRLYNFLAEKDRDAALRAVTEIRDAFTPLSRMPKVGRPVDDGLRELVIDFGSSGYLALYALDEIADELVVLAIRHQREFDYK